jgi:xanthine dehydrogenase accessory factor
MLALIRGAGDIASGIALRLRRCGFRVAMTEIDRPTTIRRTVAFSDAVLRGTQTVEDLTAVRADTPEAALTALEAGLIPVLVDPSCACLSWLKPDVLVDAILAKRNLGTAITDAPVVIGVGPGFTAGLDCHAAVETMRGHTLGRVCYAGSPLPNTNIPGLIGGYAGERVLRAPADGVFQGSRRIGDLVSAGDTVGFVAGLPVTATISGVLRGLLADGVPVRKGMKSGDVDPRGKPEYCALVSDKALSVAGGVLEAILHFSGGGDR